MGLEARAKDEFGYRANSIELTLCRERLMRKRTLNRPQPGRIGLKRNLRG